MIYYQPTQDITNIRLKPFSIAWLFPRVELETNPSDRLRRFQISRFINENIIDGNRSINIFEYDKMPDIKDKLKDIDVMVIFGIGQFDVDLIRFFREKGGIVIFDHCERIFGLACEDTVMQEVSAITCCSTALANTTETYLKDKGIEQKIFVIRDPIDDDILNRDKTYIREENTALLMGMSGNVHYTLPFLKGACDKAGYRIKVLSERGQEYYGSEYQNYEFLIWEPSTWIEIACTCSIALCCHDIYKFPDKGNVKVTMPMALGLPVIASPMQSYKEVIRSGHNGFIADNDWVPPLEILKDPGVRFTMGLKAQYSAKTLYSTEKICLDYISMIQELQG